MRVESTYAFLAQIERVFASLTDPDVLRQIIPGCERLIQLGPPEEDGAITCEARIRGGPEDAVYTLEGTIERLSRPTHLGLSAHGQGPDGPLTLRGSLDLVSQNDHTVAAYVWDLAMPGQAEDGPRRCREADAATYAQEVCERLAGTLHTGRENGDGVGDALPVLRADTRRGKIILLPPEPPNASLAARLRPLVRGVAWAGAGLLAGLAAIVVAATIVRRWGSGRGPGG
jgi:carbon monoxide dehydrogenase subunit G